jgi:uncharacterized protein (TIGR02452 family)
MPRKSATTSLKTITRRAAAAVAAALEMEDILRRIVGSAGMEAGAHVGNHGAVTSIFSTYEKLNGLKHTSKATAMDKVYASILTHYKDTPNGAIEIIPIPTIPLPSPGHPTFETVVCVVNADTLDVALEHVYGGHKTLLLNMAHPELPGGSPILVGAQEEDLFRRTNLHKYLIHKHYPLHKRALLARGVEVIHEGLRKKYASCAPAHIDIISSAAVQAHGICGGTQLSPLHAQSMLSKIHNVFYTAAYYGYTHLVLSAWGCGGFECPPEHVSRLFKKVLAEYEGRFAEVTFAIWDENYPKSNYAVFTKTLVSKDST